MYTVKHAAALTGIPAATLRMWERRYAVVTPTRTDSGYRVYDEQALQQLSTMAALVGAGWSPRLAAEHVKSGNSAAPGVTSAGDPRPTEGKDLGDVTALTRIAVGLDAVGLDALLDEMFSRGTFEEVVEGWVFPALHDLGRSWHAGSVSVAGEHFVSATVQRRIASAFDAARAEPDAPRVLVGLARGSRHELGALAFATALRRVGLDVLYLGGDMPPESWVQTVTLQEPAAVAIAVPASDDVITVRETVAALNAAAPALPVYLGGGYQDRVGGSAVLLGHSLADAAVELAGQLTVDRP